MSSPLDSFSILYQKTIVKHALQKCFYNVNFTYQERGILRCH
nr:MAG TPA: hypothetical protein [Caudoviricetes sp.]